MGQPVLEAGQCLMDVVGQGGVLGGSEKVQTQVPGLPAEIDPWPWVEALPIEEDSSMEAKEEGRRRRFEIRGRECVGGEGVPPAGGRLRGGRPGRCRAGRGTRRRPRSSRSGSKDRPGRSVALAAIRDLAVDGGEGGIPSATSSPGRRNRFVGCSGGTLTALRSNPGGRSPGRRPPTARPRRDGGHASRSFPPGSTG